MVISIIGGSGSGKDTQASILSKKYNLPHLSMGGILREEGKKGNPLGVKALSILNEGNWVPDEITSKLFQEHVEKNAPDGFVITGYPRFLEQCNSFKKILDELGLNLTAVVHIEVPDEILLKRMRAQKEEEQPGGEREDTSEEVMLKRLQSYKDTIDPILEYYKESGELVNIDGTPSIEDVTEEIAERISALLENEQ